MSTLVDGSTWDTVADVVAAVCLLGGSVLSFSAGMGLMRFPDLLARMHAATKPQVLGMMLMLVGLALRIRSAPIVWMLVLVALFQMLTSPVAAHMVARAGYRTGKVRHELLVVDELTRDLRAARAATDERDDDGDDDDDLFADTELPGAELPERQVPERQVRGADPDSDPDSDPVARESEPGAGPIAT